jgi:hypothetical protein
MPGIPALRRMRQKDCKFKACLSYIVGPCLKRKKKKGKKERKEGRRDGGKEERERQTKTYSFFFFISVYYLYEGASL